MEQVKCRCDGNRDCDMKECSHKELHIYIPEVCNTDNVCAKKKIVSCLDMDGNKIYMNAKNKEVKETPESSDESEESV